MECICQLIFLLSSAKFKPFQLFPYAKAKNLRGRHDLFQINASFSEMANNQTDQLYELNMHLQCRQVPSNYDASDCMHRLAFPFVLVVAKMHGHVRRLKSITIAKMPFFSHDHQLQLAVRISMNLATIWVIAADNTISVVGNWVEHLLIREGDLLAHWYSAQTSFLCICITASEIIFACAILCSSGL